VARDQRTRLNAELAEQYGAATGERAKAPGRTSLANETTTEDSAVDTAEVEQPEHAELAAHAEQDTQQDVEPKKSIFELPRKSPATTPRE
jgi:hypothetical protein